MFPLNKDTPKGAYTFHWITPVVTKISYNPFFETAAPHTAAVFLCPKLILLSKKTSRRWQTGRFCPQPWLVYFYV